MKPLKPMWDDPSEAESVRELLEAGRGLSAGDYDFDKGLSDHMAHVAAGTPAPEWAKEIIEGGAGNTGTGATAAGATSSAVIAAWIAVPIIAAGVAAGVWVAGDRAPAPAPQQAPVASVEAVEAPGPLGQPGAEMQAVPSAAVEVDFAPPAPEVGADELAGVKAPVGEPRARKRAARVSGASGAKALAPKTGVDGFVSRSAPKRAAVRPSGGAVEQRDQPVQQAYARGDEAAQDDAQAAPAEDLHAKWARGVNADRDVGADANDARLEREMRMLKVAQAALAQNPKRALQLARRGEREYGASMFQAERQHVVILALVQLGRMGEARKLAKPYLAKYPNGPFSARVRKALAAARAQD